MEKIDKPDNIKIHFILGPGRSGTTLLIHILNNHKNCVSSPEYKHLLLFYKKYHNMTEVTPQLLADAKKYLTTKLQTEDVANYEHYLNEDSPFTIGEKINYFEFCKRIYFSFGHPGKDKSKITTIIDKTPAYSFQVDKLRQILPDAKFLYAIRDYRSFVLSNIQSPEYYARHLPVQYHSLVIAYYKKRILKIKEKYKDRVDILRYEDFVLEKEKNFERICDFFEMENDLESFNYREKVDFNDNKDKKDERTVYQRVNLSKSINTERLEAWKGVFTDFQIKTIEFWCGEVGEKFGYETTKKSNLLEKIAIVFISLPYYIRVWVYFKINSIRLNVFLTEGRKARYFKSIKS
jgi:hypothetical protein